MYDSQYEEEIRSKIEKRYKERLGLIIHFVAFTISNLMFWGMWLFMTPAVVAVGVPAPGTAVEMMPVTMAFPWPIFVTLSWGIGIVAHFLNYYYRYGAGANQREEAIQREIEQEMARRHGTKRKNDERMHLTEDGELEVVSDDEISRAEKYKHG